jgi:hypothetical protein
MCSTANRIKFIGKLYSRAGQMDQIRGPHFRKQQSAGAMSYSEVKSSSNSFCNCLLGVAVLSKNVNMKIKIEDFRQIGKNSLYLWREMK